MYDIVSRLVLSLIGFGQTALCICIRIRAYEQKTVWEALGGRKHV